MLYYKAQMSVVPKVKNNNSGISKKSKPNVREYTHAEIQQIKEELEKQTMYVRDGKKYATAAIAKYYSDIKPIYEVDNDKVNTEIKFLQSYTNYIIDLDDNTTREGRFFNDYLSLYPYTNDKRIVEIDINNTDGNGFFFNKTLFKNALTIPMNEETLAKEIKNAPLVMIISGASMEHASIYILHGNILYTAGFGYLGKAPDQPLSVPSSLHTRFSKLTHRFERMNGAIYSSDYLQPNSEQKSQIIWMGLLDKTMCANMNEYLKKTSKITYNIFKREEENNTHTLRILPNSHLTIADAPYCELANVFPAENIHMNCLKWAVTMLNATIYCGPSEASVGVLSKPSTCRQVTEEELDKILKYYVNEKGKKLRKALITLQARLANPIDAYTDMLKAGYACIMGHSVAGGKYKARHTRKARHISKARHTRKARHISKARHTRKARHISK